MSLNLKQLNELLELNEAIVQNVLDADITDLRRLLELSYHRSLVKDCIIESLNREVIKLQKVG